MSLYFIIKNILRKHIYEMNGRQSAKTEQFFRHIPQTLISSSSVAFAQICLMLHKLCKKIIKYFRIKVLKGGAGSFSMTPNRNSYFLFIKPFYLIVCFMAPTWLQFFETKSLVSSVTTLCSSAFELVASLKLV